MPRRDGTGPMGAGPMTGRKLGPCAGNKTVKYGAGIGMGLGLGLGLGLACRRGFGRGLRRSAAMGQASSQTQKDLLENQRELLKDRLEVIEKQLENLQ